MVSSLSVRSPPPIPLSADAPSAIGPYVQAVKYNGIAYLSGCIPLDPKSVSLLSQIRVGGRARGKGREVSSRHL